MFNLCPCVHQYRRDLDFNFLTKSRHYSVTFRLLRNRRIIWRRTESGDIAAEHSKQTTLVVNLLAYAGSGLHLGERHG